MPFGTKFALGGCLIFLLLMTFPATASTHGAAPGGHLVFTSTRDGDNDVYTVAPSGGPLRALTASRADEGDVSVSNDGRRVAFADRRTQDVVVTDAAGRHRRSVGVGTPAGWSPDGTRLAYWQRPRGRPVPNALVVVNADGTGRRPLIRVGEEPWFAGWSADGRSVAVTRILRDPLLGDSYELVVADVNGNGERVVDRSRNALRAAWSPRRHALAYVRWNEMSEERRSELVVVDLDTGAATVLVRALVIAEYARPEWSPDGSRVLYTAAEGYSGFDPVELATIDARSQAVVRLATSGASGQYAWSPDGRRVAFRTRRGIEVAAADGSRRRVVTQAESLQTPKWSPDGSALAFQPSAEEIRVVSVDGGRSRAVAQRGVIELVAWTRGRVPLAAKRARSLPRVEVVTGRKLRSAGAVTQLVAAGDHAAFIAGASGLDCHHVAVWTPGRGLARAATPAPCEYHDGALGDLRIDGTAIRWSGRWFCGNSECDRIVHRARLVTPRRLSTKRTLETVMRDESGEVNLPCTFCAEPKPSRSRPARVGFIATWVTGRTVSVRLADARTRAWRVPGAGDVLARLTTAGLFVAYTLPATSYPGRIAFVPLGELDKVGEKR